MNETTTGNARVRGVRSILAGVVLFEAIVVFGYGAYLAIETLTEDATEPAAAITLAVFVMALGCGLALLARAALRGRRGARAPIVVWQLLQASLYPAVSVRWYTGVVLIACSLVAGLAPLVPGVLDDGEGAGPQGDDGEGAGPQGGDGEGAAPQQDDGEGTGSRQ